MGAASSIHNGSPHPFVCHTCCIRFTCQRPAFEETFLPRCPCCDSSEFIEDIEEEQPIDPLATLTDRLEGHGQRLNSTSLVLQMLEQQLREVCMCVHIFEKEGAQREIEREGGKMET